MNRFKILPDGLKDLYYLFQNVKIYLNIWVKNLQEKKKDFMI